MQIALNRQTARRARHAAPPTRDPARSLRPWALLALLGVTYAGYTAIDGVPALLEAREAVVPAVVAAPVLPAASQPSAITPLLIVSKCIEQGITRYTDGGCSPGAWAKSFLVAPDHAGLPVPATIPRVSAGSRQQACAEITRQIDELEQLADRLPPAGEQQTLLARRSESRLEQWRLGC